MELPPARFSNGITAPPENMIILKVTQSSALSRKKVSLLFPALLCLSPLLPPHCHSCPNRRAWAAGSLTWGWDTVTSGKLKLWVKGALGWDCWVLLTTSGCLSPHVLIPGCGTPPWADWSLLRFDQPYFTTFLICSALNAQRAKPEMCFIYLPT